MGSRMKWPADRITRSSEKSFGMYEQALPLMARGIDVIHLEVGRPSFDTPVHIKEACKAALDAGMVHYGDFLGNEPFRRALVEKLAARNGIQAAADEVLVTSGLTHGAYITCMAALDPGDEVVLLSPYYPQHINKIELAGGTLVMAPLDRSRGFALDGAAIRERLSPRTRMIILVNPANPTGRVYSRQELQELADIAIEHDLLVMSDEVYEQIVFDDARHISIASLPGMWERTITHFAFTKAYAMDGWRMGYAVAPKQLHRRDAENLKERHRARERVHTGRRPRRGLGAAGRCARNGPRGLPEAGPGGQAPECDAGGALPVAAGQHLCVSRYLRHRTDIGRSGARLAEGNPGCGGGRCVLRRRRRRPFARVFRSRAIRAAGGSHAAHAQLLRRGLATLAVDRQIQGGAVDDAPALDDLQNRLGVVDVLGRVRAEQHHVGVLAWFNRAEFALHCREIPRR